MINLYKDNKVYKRNIHRLVAQTFIKNPKNKLQVNHKDGNKLNNYADNLEFVTHKENQIHSWKTGLREKMCKKVVQYTKEGTIIKEWESISEADRQTGINRRCISACCRGKNKTAGNYIWKYKDTLN